jgi:hypothetical protein
MDGRLSIDPVRSDLDEPKRKFGESKSKKTKKQKQKRRYGRSLGKKAAKLY